MAVLDKPVGMNVVQAFRGVVDFYYWKGKPVARAWPRKAKPTQTAALTKTHNALRAAFAWKKANPRNWHTLFHTLDYPPTYCREDFKRTLALNLAYANKLQDPLPITTVTFATIQPPMQTVIDIAGPPGSPAFMPGLWIFATIATANGQGQAFTINPNRPRRYGSTRPCYAPVFNPGIPATIVYPFPPINGVRVTFPRLTGRIAIWPATSSDPTTSLPLSPVMEVPFRNEA